MHEDTGHAEGGLVSILTADGGRTLGDISPRPFQHGRRFPGSLDFQLEECSGSCGAAGPAAIGGAKRHGSVRLWRNFSTALTE